MECALRSAMIFCSTGRLFQVEKRMLLLVNPNAGKSGYKNILGDILHIFCDGGWKPTVFFTRGPGDAGSIIERNAPDYDLAVCLGGDGTLSEVASGMVRLGQRGLPIGYIPLGTTNDVARTLGISPKPLEAARAILREHAVNYDIGVFGVDKHFTYVAGFGAFTEVSYATPQESKQALGHLAYMLEGIRRLPMLTDYHAIVEYDDGVLEDDFVFGAVTNSTSVAGLVRLDAENIGLDDGMFEVILVRKPQDLLDFSNIIASILSSDFSGDNVLFLKSSEVRFLFDEPVAWTRDGEDGGKHRDVYISNCHPGIRILV